MIDHFAASLLQSRQAEPVERLDIFGAMIRIAKTSVGQPLPERDLRLAV